MRSRLVAIGDSVYTRLARVRQAGHKKLLEILGIPSNYTNTSLCVAFQSDDTKQERWLVIGKPPRRTVVTHDMWVNTFARYFLFGETLTKSQVYHSNKSAFFYRILEVVPCVICKHFVQSISMKLMLARFYYDLKDT